MQQLRPENYLQQSPQAVQATTAPIAPVQPAAPVAQVAPVQPTQPLIITPSAPDSASFMPDLKTQEILDQTYPEILNAMVNIAIKKFSLDPEFYNFYLKDSLKDSLTIPEKQEEIKTSSAPSNQGTGKAPTSGPSMDFTSW